MQRGNKNIKKIGQTTMQAGDRMILATGKDFNINKSVSNHFYFLSKIKQENKLDNKSSLLVILGFLSVILCFFYWFIIFCKSIVNILWLPIDI